MAVKTIPAKNVPETTPPIDDEDDDEEEEAPASTDCSATFSVNDDFNCELVIPRAASAAGDNANASVKTPLERPSEMAASTSDARIVTDTPIGADTMVEFNNADICTPTSIISPPAARPRFLPNNESWRRTEDVLMFTRTSSDVLTPREAATPTRRAEDTSSEKEAGLSGEPPEGIAIFRLKTSVGVDTTAVAVTDIEGDGEIVLELVPLAVCEGEIVLDGVVVCEGVPEREGVDVEVSVIVFVLLGLFEGVCVEDIVSELVPLTVCVTVAVLDEEVVCEGVPEREGVDVEVSVIVFVLLGLFEGVCVEDIVSELVGLCEGVCVDDIVLELVPLTV